MQSFYSCEPEVPQGRSTAPAPRLTFQDEKSEKKWPVRAAIVSLCSGSSYDRLFTEQRQEIDRGRVHVYSASLDVATLEALAELVQLVGADAKRASAANDNDNDADANTDASAAVRVRAGFEELAADLRGLPPSAVVFNFECCSSCNEGGFSGANAAVASFIVAAIGAGVMVMVSDFSLKALIASWPRQLGVCPFKNVGACSSSMTLRFDPKTLDKCASAQLQAVGKLCSGGLASIHCMGGTIVYSLKTDVQMKTSQYEISVLTVATTTDGSDALARSHGVRLNVPKKKNSDKTDDPKEKIVEQAAAPAAPAPPSKISSLFSRLLNKKADKKVDQNDAEDNNNNNNNNNDNNNNAEENNNDDDDAEENGENKTTNDKNNNNDDELKKEKRKKKKKKSKREKETVFGTLGHCALTFKSGGTLLTSAGHWLELSNLSTSESEVFYALRCQFGEAVASSKMEEYCSMSFEQQAAQLQSYGQMCVQKSAPCQYM